MIEKKAQKKPLGQQLIENHLKYAGQTNQTLRETTDEMGKEYMKSLQKTVELHRGMTEDYYITEIMRPDPNLVGVINLKHVARKTRPLPEWGLALYKVHVKSGELTYEWGLPHWSEAYVMLQNPEGWEAKTIKDIYDFVYGRLV